MEFYRYFKVPSLNEFAKRLFLGFWDRKTRRGLSLRYWRFWSNFESNGKRFCRSRWPVFCQISQRYVWKVIEKNCFVSHTINSLENRKHSLVIKDSSMKIVRWNFFNSVIFGAFWNKLFSKFSSRPVLDLYSL